MSKSNPCLNLTEIEISHLFINVGVIVCFCIFPFLFSCKKDTPGIGNKKNIASKIRVISGDIQTGEFNTSVKDSLVIRVTDLQDKPVSHAPVIFETANGTGKVSTSYIRTDSSGFARVQLTLSCTATEHQIKAYLCDEDSKYIDSVLFRATSVKPLRWGKACGLNYAADKIYEYGNKFFALSQQKLFVSNDGGTNWDLFPNLPADYVFDLQFNSKGWMYLLTDSKGVFYSTNKGVTWENINNGIIDTRYPLSFLIEDTVMYVSFRYDGLYRTRNNGQFWKKLLINGNYSEEYGFVTRHPSGKLYIFNKWDELWVSSNGGDNWSATNLSYSYRVYEITAFKIGTNGLLYIGSGDATIAVVSPDTYTGEIHSYYKYNASSQSVNNIFLKNNTVYFTLSGNPNPGIYSSDGWKRLENGFYKAIQSIYLKDDGKFLTGVAEYSGGGLFYE